MSRLSVCPWWAGYTLNGTLRRLRHNPQRILNGAISVGMKVMDIGCGMGFFTIPMAQAVGETGKVIAVDLQRKMLDGMLKKAEKAGVHNRIETHQCGSDSLEVEEWNSSIDFALVFMMLHEVPNQKQTIHELYTVLAESGKILFAEPIIHVRKKEFQRSLNEFEQAGFRVLETPSIPYCMASILTKCEEKNMHNR